MRLSLATFVSLLATAEALHTGRRIEGNPEREHTPHTPLLPRTPSHLEARTPITVKAAAVSTGAGAVALAIGLCGYVALMVKHQSDIKSCSVISGSADGVNWQYKVITSGKNCDTTAEVKTIKDGLQKAIDWMRNKDKGQACFKMNHGSGTWEGNLQVSINKPIFSDAKCSGVKWETL